MSPAKNREGDENECARDDAGGLIEKAVAMDRVMGCLMEEEKAGMPQVHLQQPAQDHQRPQPGAPEEHRAGGKDEIKRDYRLGLVKGPASLAMEILKTFFVVR